VSGLVLSLFPGIGLLDMAFEESGFCVVRGPDLLWGGDIRRFHPPAGKFDGVIGGPPCQMFSRLRHVNPKCGENVGNLIPEFERCVAEAAPSWFLMENVEAAPPPAVEGYDVHAQLLRDIWVEGGVTNRLRRFSFGTRDGRNLVVETLALHSQEPEPSAYASGGGRTIPVALGGSGKVKSTRLREISYQDRGGLERALRVQGLPADFLADAPFTVAGKHKVVGNGVPVPLGRAVAKAVKKAIQTPLSEQDMTHDPRAPSLFDPPEPAGPPALAGPPAALTGELTIDGRRYRYTLDVAGLTERACPERAPGPDVLRVTFVLDGVEREVRNWARRDAVWALVREGLG
jgi:DNA (cytosine-5)-methyltransferase 1